MVHVQAQRRTGRDRATALGFATALVAYGNAAALLSSAGTSHPAVVPVSLALLTATLVWGVRGYGLSLREVGLIRRGAALGALMGFAVALVVIAPVLLYFAWPVLAPGGSIDYERAEEFEIGSFLLWALVRQPIGVSLFEETMFRGVLQALSVRAFAVPRGVVLTALTFALWHLVVNARTIGDTSFSENLAWTALARAGSMLGLFIGALAFSALRLATGGLAAPMAFHWTTVVAMQATLVALGG